MEVHQDAIQIRAPLFNILRNDVMFACIPYWHSDCLVDAIKFRCGNLCDHCRQGSMHETSIK